MELRSMKASIDRFLTYLKEERESAKNTVLAYSTDITQFEQVIAANAGKPVAPGELEPQMVLEYGQWLEEQGYRPSTVSRKMAAARAFLQYLEQAEGAVRPRMYAQLQPPSSPRKLPLTLSQEQVKRLLKAPTKAGTPRGLRDAAILALLYSAGLRASEAVQVDMADLDLEAGNLQRDGEEPTTLKLGGAKRPIADYLKTGRPYLVRDKNETALFLNLRGKRLSRQGLWLVVKRWAAASNLAGEISPHSLRHSLIHHLLMQGKSKREIQDLLGLSSPNAIRVRLAPPQEE
jgi:integrase/recombinase XerD